MQKDQCMRCGAVMRDMGEEEIQLGRIGFLTGTLGSMFAGSLEVSIYMCTGCGKLEFYSAGQGDQDQIAQISCPSCNGVHDLDYPKCPHCGHKYI